MTNICTVREIRTNLEIAHELWRQGVGFVVLPVLSRADFVELTMASGERLEKLALAAERAQRDRQA